MFDICSIIVGKSYWKITRCQSISRTICSSIRAKIVVRHTVGLWWDPVVQAQAFTLIHWARARGMHWFLVINDGVCFQQTRQRNCSKWHHKWAASNVMKQSHGLRTFIRKRNCQTGHKTVNRYVSIDLFSWPIVWHFDNSEIPFLAARNLAKTRRDCLCTGRLVACRNQFGWYYCGYTKFLQQNELPDCLAQDCARTSETLKEMVARTEGKRHTHQTRFFVGFYRIYFSITGKGTTFVRSGDACQFGRKHWLCIGQFE